MTETPEVSRVPEASRTDLVVGSQLRQAAVPADVATYDVNQDPLAAYLQALRSAESQRTKAAALETAARLLLGIAPRPPRARGAADDTSYARRLT